MKKRKWIFAVAAAAIAALALGGYRVWLSRQPLEWAGTVEARSISIGSRVGGRVAQVLVQEGDTVKAGDALVILEPGDLAAKRLESEAALSAARATLARLEAGALPEEIAAATARARAARAAVAEAVHGPRAEDIAAALSRYRAADSLAKQAERDRDRLQGLFEKGAAPQAKLETAQANAASATDQAAATQQQYEALVKGTRTEEKAVAQANAEQAGANERLTRRGARREDLELAQANVQAAEARIAQVDVSIAELTIRAPRASVIEVFDLRPGDLVAPNATAAVLLEADQLYVRIYVPETQLGHLQVGREVPVTVDSFADQTFSGRVVRINDQGEYTPRNLQTRDDRANQVFAARVELDEHGGRLRAGMAAFVRVPR